MKILFVCAGNSGRSLMAECFFNKYSTKDKAISAGWRVDEEVHPDTVTLMKELDIDVSKYKPRMLGEEDMKEASKIIAINTNAYNHIPDKYRDKTENWELPILMDKPFDEVREIRYGIEIKVKELIKKLETTKQIKFTPELVPLILNGSKTSTWRLFDDKNLSKEDDIELVNKETKEIFGKANITSVKEVKIKDLTDEDKEGHEKYESEEELIKIISNFYKDKKVDENTVLKIIRFKLR